MATRCIATTWAKSYSGGSVALLASV
jgi:hypothetical protein